MSDQVSALGNPITQATVISSASSTTPASTAQGPTVAKAQEATVASSASQVELSSASGAAQALADTTPMTMAQAAQAFQSYLSSLPSNLQLQPNADAGMVVIKVINPVTQKVIRQLPSDDVIQQAKFLRNAEKQNHSGILLDESL